MLDDEFSLEREDEDSADVFVKVLASSETETVEEDEDGEDQEAGFGEVDVDYDENEEISDDREDDDGDGEEDGEDQEAGFGEVDVDYDEDEDISDDREDDDGEGEEVEEVEENDGEFDVSADEIEDLLQMVHPRKFVPDARFLGASAPRVTAVGNTAGFMRVKAADIQEGGDNCDKQILVHYRYNCFSAASSVGGVEACGVEQRVQLRFIAAAGHGARSLEWAGASMAPLIYPGHSSYLLRELWSSLIADVNIPVHAARIEVFVDVGILRPADCTPERMGKMISALENMMAEPWYGSFHAELHLPEPVRGVTEDEAAEDDKDYEERPAKRRRVVAVGESCVVCLEMLEGDDLAAWPGCGKPHVFHAACLKCVLENSRTCPICRRSML